MADLRCVYENCGDDAEYVFAGFSLYEHHFKEFRDIVNKVLGMDFMDFLDLIDNAAVYP